MGIGKIKWSRVAGIQKKAAVIPGNVLLAPFINVDTEVPMGIISISTPIP